MNSGGLVMRPETTAITELTSLPSPRRTVQFTPYRLRPLVKLSRAHLALTRRPSTASAMREAFAALIASLGQQLKLELSGTVELQANTLHPFSNLAARALFITLELGGEATALLELDPHGAAALVNALTGSGDAPAPPSRLTSIEEAALGWLVLTALAELRSSKAFFGVRPRLVALTLDRGVALTSLDVRRRHLAVLAELQLGSTNALARLLLPSDWVLPKLESLRLESGLPLHPSVAEATLPVTCIIGGALLPLRDTLSLSPGDVVLFEGVRHGASALEGVGRLIGPSFELRGHFNASGFSITRALERPTPESPMSAAVDPAVPVEVEIELTRVRLAVNQLAELRPGGLIPLQLGATQIVLVRIGDRVVARAELVDIEGEVGARILSMV